MAKTQPRVVFRCPCGYTGGYTKVRSHRGGSNNPLCKDPMQTIDARTGEVSGGTPVNPRSLPPELTPEEPEKLEEEEPEEEGETPQQEIAEQRVVVSTGITESPLKKELYGSKRDGTGGAEPTLYRSPVKLSASVYTMHDFFRSVGADDDIGVFIEQVLAEYFREHGFFLEVVYRQPNGAKAAVAATQRGE